MSVLKGAVLFRHKPGYIASRVMRFSYGADISPLFDPDKHEQRRKFTSAVEGTDRCRNVFEEIIQQNKSVVLGTKVSHHYSTTIPNESSMAVAVYAPPKRNQCTSMKMVVL